MDSESKDHCTGFFENWVRWKSPVRWEIFPLSELCKEHDKNCGSGVFLKLLTKNRVVGGLLIWAVASVACWVRYPKLMIKKV